MPHKTFFAFILPSLIAMVLFIALPIVSVVVQSFYVEHGRILVEVENCQPFGGCTKEVRVDAAATAKLEKEQPLGQFNGLGTYFNRGHLAVNEIGAILADNRGLADALLLGRVPRALVAQRQIVRDAVGDRAAPGAGDHLLLSKLVEVAPDGGLRDSEPVRRVLDADPAVLGQQLEQGVPPRVPVHPHPCARSV